MKLFQEMNEFMKSVEYMHISLKKTGNLKLKYFYK